MTPVPFSSSSQANDVIGAEALQEPPRIADGDLRRLAFDHLVAFSADREGRIEHDDVPQHEGIEQPTQGRQVQLARRRSDGEAFQVAADVGRCHLSHIEARCFAPVAELPHGVQVGFARVRIADLPVQKLFKGEACRRSGPLQHDRQRHRLWSQRYLAADFQRLSSFFHLPP